MPASASNIFASAGGKSGCSHGPAARLLATQSGIGHWSVAIGCQITLIRFFGSNQVFGSDDLPAAVALNPGVDPDETSALAGVFFSSLASLRDCSFTVEPHFHIV